jgi:hypothetical protein
MLPDDVLLDIFDHHRLAAQDYSVLEPWEWHRLAHVCKRWRTIIFDSPRRLELRLVYTYRKPPRKNLDCWPDLPLSIWYPRRVLYHHLSHPDEVNAIAALKHAARICQINLTLTRPLLEKLSPLMQDPFPVLEDLQLGSRDLIDSLSLPSTFLGGSTPRLRSAYLDGIPFPTLPQLLLSAPDLVSLRLCEIPNTGYFSPEALVTGMEATPRLKFLEIGWSFPTSRPSQQSSLSPYPQTHVALPALSEFHFRGDNEYLEDVVAGIDAPNVEQFNVKLFEQDSFDLPQLAEFTRRTEELMASPHRTSIWLWERGFSITHYFGSPSPGRTFQLQISCHELTRQMALLTRVCRQLSPLVAGVGWLDIEADVGSSGWGDNSDAAQWLELFSPFGAVRRLELIGHLVPSAVSALKLSSVGNANVGRCNVLPSLRDLYLRSVDSPLPIESFLATRRRSGRAVSIHYAEAGDEGHDP